MTMKINSPVLFSISILIFLSSCASLNHSPSKEATKKAVQTKIDSRDYIIDIGLSNYVDYGNILLPYIRDFTFREIL